MLKITYRIILLFAYIIILNNQLKSQTIGEVSMQIQIVNPTTLELSLFIKRLGPTSWNLGVGSFVFHYNHLALSNPVELQEGIWDNNTSSDYGDQISSSFGPEPYQYRSVDISINFPATGTAIPITEELLGKIQFTIINPGANASIIWDDGSLMYSGITNSFLEDVTSQINFVDPPDVPLPIQLSSFSHSVVKNDITLKWKTNKEINNKEFIVERKNVNSEGWSSSGSVQGKGNTNTITEYSFSDKNLQTGKYNYRLKQVDYNGNFEYHNLNTVVEVGVPDKFELSQNYPNPFNPTTKIDYQLPFDSKVDIRIYDVTGREVKTLVNENSKAGYYSFEFNANQLSSGIYFYRIISKSSTKDFVMTKKMMLIK